MKSIFITGGSGFVGTNLIKYLSPDYNIYSSKKGDAPIIFQDVVIHLAGIAHDLKNVSGPSDYYNVNTQFTKEVFDKFLNSSAKIFIFLSSVKAVADIVPLELIEEEIPNPTTHYGKSKLLAEEYILSFPIPNGKRVYLLRPCMIHGPGNKGNLNLLYNIVSKGLPWPLGLFENYRSYLYIDNLCFIIKELIEREDITSGVYNVADDKPIATNEVIKLIAESNGKKFKILNISTNFVMFLARVGDYIKFPLNSERLKKLSESYIVSNTKIKSALGKSLPVSSKDGLKRTFKFFAENV